MDENWFASLNWSGECLLCKAKNNGNCPDIDCAKMNYDKNGNKIPLDVWYKDGNMLQQYLESVE